MQNLIQQTSLTTPESKSNALTGIVCATTFHIMSLDIGSVWMANC
jgi:hypothetical protein